MDAPPEQSTPTGAAPAHLTPRKAVRSRRRRPTGAPPPLPRHLRTSWVGWLVAAGVRAGLLLALLFLRRWRHLLVWAVAWPLVNALAYVLVAAAARRLRPFGVNRGA